MTITQTVEIPANRLITVPHEVPAGRTVITFTPAPESSYSSLETHPCPVCAGNIDPETGNPRYNAETAAAIKEGQAMLRGEIPAKWFNSLDEMLEELEKDEPEEN